MKTIIKFFLVLLLFASFEGAAQSNGRNNNTSIVLSCPPSYVDTTASSWLIPGRIWMNCSTNKVVYITNDNVKHYLPGAVSGGSGGGSGWALTGTSTLTGDAVIDGGGHKITFQNESEIDYKSDIFIKGATSGFNPAMTIQDVAGNTRAQFMDNGGLYIDAGPGSGIILGTPGVYLQNTGSGWTAENINKNQECMAFQRTEASNNTNLSIGGVARAVSTGNGPAANGIGGNWVIGVEDGSGLIAEGHIAHILNDVTSSSRNSTIQFNFYNNEGATKTTFTEWISTSTADIWFVFNHVPTSNPCGSAPSGTLWNNSGVLNICP